MSIISNRQLIGLTSGDFGGQVNTSNHLLYSPNHPSIIFCRVADHILKLLPLVNSYFCIGLHTQGAYTDTFTAESAYNGHIDHQNWIL